MNSFRPYLLGTTLLAIGAVFPQELSARELTIGERVEAQRVVERVYWSHRIWPKENQGTKPPFEASISEAELRARVEDYLKASSALESIWNRPIRAEELQAEIDRMIRESRQPETLRELHAALKDPFVIAECLARPSLAKRLLRSWYSTDTRFQEASRSRAQVALEGCAKDLSLCAGEYAEIEYERTEARDGGRPPAGSGAIELPPDEWTEYVHGLARVLGGGSSSDAAALPLRTTSPLEESDTDFHVVKVLERTANRVKLAVARWPKPAFDSWWAEAAAHLPAEVSPPGETYVVALPAGAACTPDTWTSFGEGSPTPRTWHTAVWTGTEMIVWGGTLDAGNYLGDGGIYDPVTDTWRPMNREGAPVPRGGHTAVWTGSRMIVWGGYGYDTDTLERLDSGAQYDPVSDTWSATSEVGAPSARTEHTVVWTGSRMIVWGGYGREGSSTWELDTGGAYDPATDSWTTVSTNGAPSARQGHTAVWTGSRMIVWGGTDSSYQYFADGGSYDPVGDVWIPLSTIGAPLARAKHYAVWTGSRMLLWGGIGQDEEPKDTGALYDPVTDSWRPISTTAVPEPRTNGGAIWTGSRLVVWGGGDYEPSETGGVYDPASDTWAPTSLNGAPLARTRPTAVWTGSKMIVWGGGIYGVANWLQDSGGLYDPESDTWSPTSVARTPFRRAFHTAVWTGSEMIAWGGTSWGPYFRPDDLDTGVVYDPATASWTATSLDDAPSPRSFHTALWTGSEMIVWGGAHGYGSVGDGGRYDPSTNRWTPLSAVGAPSPRYYHTAVWTGTKMIVWGGYDHLFTGGVYDPVQDTWTPTSTIDYPEGRYLHSAVWTGSEMIIWGGRAHYDTSDWYFFEGSRYDPGTNSWRYTSLINCPRGRYGHVGLWTGSKMLIWGGSFPGGFLGDGSNYDPATDTWTPILADGAPSVRDSESAIWTGNSMIVWGGRVSDPGHYFHTNDGGILDPATDAWVLTSRIGAPTRRSFASAVWTGTEMIVTGGWPLSDGSGSYCPATCTQEVWFLDGDGDTYGDPAVSQSSCEKPAGFVTSGTDCNDANAGIHPGAFERFNGIDDDCDGIIDKRYGTIDLPGVKPFGPRVP